MFLYLEIIRIWRNIFSFLWNGNVDTNVSKWICRSVIQAYPHFACFPGRESRLSVGITLHIAIIVLLAFHTESGVDRDVGLLQNGQRTYFTRSFISNRYTFSIIYLVYIRATAQRCSYTCSIAALDHIFEFIAAGGGRRVNIEREFQRQVIHFSIRSGDTYHIPGLGRVDLETSPAFPPSGLTSVRLVFVDLRCIVILECRDIPVNRTGEFNIGGTHSGRQKHIEFRVYNKPRAVFVSNTCKIQVERHVSTLTGIQSGFIDR